MNCTILGKSVVGRLETLKYASERFRWQNRVIGISAFYGFWAWIYGRINKRKVIYYCIDFYSPKIADNLWDRVFIWAAMQMDKFLIMHCDMVWDISEKINEGRWEFGLYGAPEHHIVPMAYPPEYFKYQIRNTIKCVFVGLVPYGKELMPEDTVMINGNMPLQKMLCKISRCSIGLGLWGKKGNNYYGDPGKLKLYLACGIPVITTDNNPTADLIKKYECGIVCEYSKNSVNKAIKEILGFYSHFKGNVLKTWHLIDANEVFRNKNLLEQ